MKTGFTAFKSGFSYLFLTSLSIWMISLIVILLIELFRPGDLDFRAYFAKIWKLLVYSFEYVAYAGIIIAPILIYNSEDEKLTYSMTMAAAIIVSSGFLYLRTQTPFYQVTMARKSKEKRPARAPRSEDSDW